MKLNTPCAVCIEKEPPELRSGDGYLQDSGVIIVECPEGHKSAVIYKVPKHHVLLMSACDAMINEYYRESVSSISAALERCYEYFIRCALTEMGANTSNIEVFWKNISRQSERQYGAFAALYLFFAKSPFFAPPSIIEFRNKIIHAGYFSTIEETVNYSRSVYDLILIIDKLASDLSNNSIKEVNRVITESQKNSIPNNMIYVEMTMRGVEVKNNEVVGPIPTFDGYLRNFVDSQNWIERMVGQNPPIPQKPKLE